jgi:hypothetical protein
MRLKIRCDGWKRKYFGFACEVNTLKVEIAFSKSNSYSNWNVQFSFVLYEIIVMV